MQRSARKVETLRAMSARLRPRKTGIWRELGQCEYSRCQASQCTSHGSRRTCKPWVGKGHASDGANILQDFPGTREVYAGPGRRRQAPRLVDKQVDASRGLPRFWLAGLLSSHRQLVYCSIASARHHASTHRLDRVARVPRRGWMLLDRGIHKSAVDPTDVSGARRTGTARAATEPGSSSATGDRRSARELRYAPRLFRDRSQHCRWSRGNHIWLRTKPDGLWVLPD